MGTNCCCCKPPHILHPQPPPIGTNNPPGPIIPQPIQTYKKYNLKHKFEYSDNITTFLLELKN